MSVARLRRHSCRQHGGASAELLLAITALLAALAALAIALAGGGGVSVAPGAAASDSGLEVAELRGELERLRRRLTDLQAAQSTAPSVGGRTQVLDQRRIDEMVADALERRAAAGGGDGLPTTPAERARRARALELARQLEQASFGARDELWQELRDAGGLDAAVEYFEQIAKANPGSADAQTDLGNALIQQLLATTDEQQRIAIGERIDQQFDRALEAQPDHWEARFRKAVGLTYGSELSGRRDQAIGHFETLVRQQANQAPQQGFSDTYLYLGRLYAQRGDTERARTIWQQGLSRHPQNAELQQLLGN